MSNLGLTLGWVPLARPTFDVPLAEAVTRAARAALEGAGFTVVGPEGLVSTVEEAQQAAGLLAQQPLDLLVVFQATFADSTPAQTLAAQVAAPLLLWAVPEARTGGRLRLNSLCGINLAAHALKRAGRQYETVYAAPGEAAALARVEQLARAGRARRTLRGARLGRVGENPAGFESCLVNWEGLLQTLGLEVVQLSLAEVFAGARAADPAAVEATLQAIAARVAGLEALEPTALRRTLAAYLTLRQLAGEQNLAGLAVRCWPEFFTDLGGAACGAMALLSDELTPCSCEADVNGTVTQLLLQAISGEAAFGTDLVSFDLEEGTAVLWHCGLAPLAMADPEFQPRGTVHSNRKLPLLLEFPLKPGRVTLARLSEATGGFRLVVGSGEMVRAPLSFSGTSGVLRFDRPAREVLETILGEGLEHHVSLTYGDYVPALLALARWLGLPVLRL